MKKQLDLGMQLRQAPDARGKTAYETGASRRPAITPRDRHLSRPDKDVAICQIGLPDHRAFPDRMLAFVSALQVVGLAGQLSAET